MVKHPSSGLAPSAKHLFPSRGRRSFRGSRARYSRAPSSSPSPSPSLSPSDYRLGRDMFPGPVGGRLSLFVSAWENFTQDPFILSVVARGFQISVSPDFPGVLRKATQTLRDWVSSKVLEEILSVIFKKAITQVTVHPDLCLSPIFVIPKGTWGLRVI